VSKYFKNFDFLWLAQLKTCGSSEPKTTFT
jgi:hypothetical protein